MTRVLHQAKKALSTQSTNAQHILCLAILAAIQFKFLHLSFAAFPLSYWDEVNYITHGLEFTFKPSTWPALFSWGFIYVLWYSAVSLFTADPLKLAYITFLVTTIALPFGCYFLLRAANCRPVVALFGAAWVLLLPATSFPHPKINHFNLLLWIPLLLFFIRKKISLTDCLWLTSAFGFVLVYLRQENLVSAGIALYAAALISLYRRKISRTGKVVLPINLALILIIALFSPLDQSKTWETFVDHHYYFEHRKRELPINNYDKSTFLAYTSDQFGGATSIKEAIILAPKKFFVSALEKNWSGLKELFFFLLTIWLPKPQAPLPAFLISSSLLLFLFFLLSDTWRHPPRKTEIVALTYNREIRLFLALVGIFAAKSIVITSVSSYTPRYTLDLIFCLIVLMALCCDRIRLMPQSPLWASLALGGLFFAYTPEFSPAYLRSLASTPGPAQDSAEEFLGFHETLRFVRSARGEPDTRLLANSPVLTYGHWSGKDQDLRAHPFENRPIHETIRKHQINLIVFDRYNPPVRDAEGRILTGELLRANLEQQCFAKVSQNVFAAVFARAPHCQP